MTLDLKRKSFLVIDDQSFQRALTAETLRALGASQIENANGVAAALQILRQFRPTVILCDWDMPETDGLGFLQMLRKGQTPLDRSTPFILITERTAPSDVEVARMAGVDEFAGKPFTTEVLARRLESVLLRKRPFVDCPKYVGPCRRRKLESQYEGPRRRLFDAEPGGDTAEAIALKAEANQKLAQAKRVAQGVAVLDRSQIRLIYAAGKEVHAISERLNDPLLRNAAASLGRYIEAVGASGAFDPRVAEAHMDAMTQLIALPHAHQDLREQVARALKALVQKKLAAPAA